MLTAYDAMTASVFDEAGIPVILVGDSMGNCHLGYDTTVPVTMDEMTSSAAVVRGTRRALVVGDLLPSARTRRGPSRLLRNATRLVKDAGVGAIKLEGGERSLPQTELLVQAGIPVMSHLGLTPQSVNTMGYRVQGRSDEAAHRLPATPRPRRTRARSRSSWSSCRPSWPPRSPARCIPTIGIGAGAGTDAQSSSGPTWPV